MSDQSKSKVLIYVMIGGVALLIVLFAVGLNLDRDSFRDPNELVWEDLLQGTWAFTNNNDVEEILQFGGTQQYILMLSDVQFSHLSRQGRYKFLEVSEESVTLELLPETEEQVSQIIELTKVDDGQLLGNFTTDNVEEPYELDRRI